jgi:hypothetical protein
MNRKYEENGWDEDGEEQRTPIEGNEIPETLQQRNKSFKSILIDESKANGEDKTSKKPVFVRR